MKKQIWLTPHQIDLLVDVLMLTNKEVSDYGTSSALVKMSHRYCSKRIQELLNIISPIPKKDASK